MASLMHPTHYPDITLPFKNCVFAAFTINFGPLTVCYPHRDIKNLAWGWCAITALGVYDWTRGGHLVVWDLKLVIEFPPGTTVLLPSAMLCHGNTRVQPGEERFSFAMYSAGGLFRWVEHDFQLESKYKEIVKKSKNVADKLCTWIRGVAMFSTLEELRTGNIDLDN